MADYLLVHGGKVSTDTWNFVAQKNEYPPGDQLGGEIWKNVTLNLQASGHRVFAPTLKDEHSYNLSEHIEQICALIIEHDLTNIILVGHSYGGMIITGVANKMAGRIKQLVYLDAALPDPGQSLFDILKLGGLDPVSVVGGAPKAYTEKLQFDVKNLEMLAKTYIYCTESEFKPVTNLAKQKIALNSEGWRFIEIQSSHLPQASMPKELAQLLAIYSITR